MGGAEVCGKKESGEGREETQGNLRGDLRGVRERSL